MKNKRFFKNFAVKFFTPIFAILLIYASYKVVQWGYNWARPKTWTLFIWEEEGTANDKYELVGYGNQKDCMEKGMELSKGRRFACGYDCDTDQWGTTCDIVCGKKGCSN